MFLALILPFFMSSVLAYDGESRLYYDLEQAEEYFTWFVKAHNKTYISKNEEKLRFEIFKHNLGLINENNEVHGNIVFGVNPFTDLTTDELLKGYTGLKRSTQVKQGSFCTIMDEDDIKIGDLPREFDWRNKNVVAPVLNQGECGSCWAVAAIGNIESLNAIKTGDFVKLSEQQLVDCDESNCGCCGGYSEQAFQYLTGVGVATNKDYPYAGVKHETCKYKNNKPRVLVNGCSSYDFTNEDKLRQILVERGPAVIHVDATDLQLHRSGSYGGGILARCDVLNGINHAVLLVGYGEENDVPFWIVKNSWGESWGEKGYFRVLRGINACGMLDSFVNYASLA